MPRSRGPAVLTLVVGLAAATTLTAFGVWRPSATDPGAGASQPPATSSPTARVDLSTLPVGRTLDCEWLAEDDVQVALGAAVSSQDSYVSGDRVEVAEGVRDVVHEDGCVFRASSSEARVWVHAAPVSTAAATDLVRGAGRAQGCSVVAASTRFGDPGVTDVCTASGSRSTTATMRGLFGDAWLSCSLEVEGSSAADVRARAERWCTQVAATLGAAG